MKRLTTPLCFVVLNAALLLIQGCSEGASGPELAHTTGKITINGEAAPGLSVYFEAEGAPPAMGMTNENGVYELVSTGGRKGASLGLNRVRIIGRSPDLPESSLAEIAAAQGTTVEALKAQPVIPARYNDQTELTAEVSKGSNEFNFDLEMKKK